MSVMISVLLLLTTAGSAVADGLATPGSQAEWCQVVGDTSQVSGGFGTPDNIIINHLEPHAGHLFAVTFNGQSGAEVWKSGTGIDWTLVHSGGIGTNSATIQDFVSFKGLLYAASATDSSCVWRSATGTDWTPVDGPCAGPSSPNVSVWKFAVFDDHLYAGTESQFFGCEIWRTSDGESWQPVVTGGFGNSGTEVISEFEVFRGQLYAATSGIGGCDLWRSSDGLAWTQVMDGCFPRYSWLGNLEVFQGTLYAGASFSGLPGFNLWTSDDGVHWTEGAHEPSHLLQATDQQLFSTTLGSPYQVLASSDGIDWAPDNEPKFGNPNNYRYTGIGVFRGYLYVAAENGIEGSELWRKFVGLFADGFESGTTGSWISTFP